MEFQRERESLSYLTVPHFQFWMICNRNIFQIPSEVGPLSRFARPQTVAEQLAEKRNWATGIAVLAYFYVIR